ncbi:MAG: rod shape-determining protein MreC [Clostridiales bacterium]|nr:rod shape-determining protein MreC [Clostridiales bacterium]
MNFFREHRKGATVALVIVLLTVVTVASFVSMGSNTWFGRQVESVVSWVQKPLTAAADGIGDFFYGMFRFREVQKENEELKDRVSSLEMDLLEQKLLASELTELRQLRDLLNSNALTEYDYVTSRVTAMDNARWFSTFTIGAGTNDGIHKDAVVVSRDGLVGRVLEVGPSWSKVIAVINENNNISFKVMRDLNVLGMLSGSGDGSLQGYLLDPEASVVEGDVLVTSGMELYPEGIVIGRVSSVTVDEDTMLVNLTVEPAASFKNIQTVTVILTESGERN